jgi:general secretion pathway protein A
LTAGSLHSSDAAIYETFYGLAQSPFTLAPDPRFLYLSESHDTAIRQVLRAIHRKESFIVLTGDIGTGKSTLCRALIERLDKTTFSSLVLNPFLSVDELLRQMLVDFGVVSREALRSERFAQASKHELTSTLLEFLSSLAPLHASAVLIVDEAQHLSPRVLEELRVISSLETDESKLLQMIFVGQPNLLSVLAAADMRQLDQRISLRATLAPLGREDVEQYINHRLTVAGESLSVIFEKNAVKRVHALSAGVPRVVNLLCDRALMAGAEAAVHEITPEMIDRAAAALSFRRRPAEQHVGLSLTRRTWLMVAAGTLAALTAGVLLFAPLHRFVGDTGIPPVPPAPPRRIIDTARPVSAEVMALAEALSRPRVVEEPLP